MAITHFPGSCSDSKEDIHSVFDQKNKLIFQSFTLWQQTRKPSMKHKDPAKNKAKPTWSWYYPKSVMKDFYIYIEELSKTPDTKKFTAEMQALISDISQDAGFNGVNGQLFKLYNHIKHHAQDRAKLLKFPKIFNLVGFGKVTGPDHTWNLQ